MFSTTLVKEGLSEIREYILSAGEDTPKIAYIHREPTRIANYSPKLDLAFFLASKELCLAGKDVACYPLVDIHTALFKETEEAERLEERIADVGTGIIAIRGFHDAGGSAASFMTPYESAYFASWFIRRLNDGGGFVLQGYAPIMSCDDWWPLSFLGYIRSRAVSFGVSA